MLDTNLESQLNNKQRDYRFEINTHCTLVAIYFYFYIINISPAFSPFFGELMCGRTLLMNLCNSLASSKLLMRADCSYYPDCFPNYDPLLKLLVVIFKMLTGGMYLHLFLHFLLLSALCLSSIVFFSV